MDFTLQTYQKLLTALHQQGFRFLHFKDFQTKDEKKKTIVLRHDVDARKENSLQFAKIQHAMGIVGTYYFRVVPQSFDEKVIRQIAELGHEIGYHYETMDTVSRKIKDKRAKIKGESEKILGESEKIKDWLYEELIDVAYEEFCRNLEMFRKIVPIKTICMHGSPLSKFDNRAIWEKYDYKKLGIVAEPYFDVDFSKVFYLTDTGRRWDGEKVSVRDKVGVREMGMRRMGEEERKGDGEMGRDGEEERGEKKKRKERGEEADIPKSLWAGRFSHLGESEGRVEGKLDNEQYSVIGNQYHFRSTFDIIKSINDGTFPDVAMMTFHPQRWTDNQFLWIKEFCFQNIKNQVKRFLVK